MRIQNEKLELSSNDLTSPITSSPLWLAHIVNYSIQITTSGTPNGTFKLQVSNDEGSKSGSNATVLNWADSVINVTITSAGSIILEDKDCTSRWVRLVWTDSGSAGGSVIEEVRFNVKGI